MSYWATILLQNLFGSRLHFTLHDVVISVG